MKGFTNLSIKKASLVVQMVKNLPAMQETWFNPTPVLLHGEFHGQMILTGYSPRGHRVGHYWALTFTAQDYKPLVKYSREKKKSISLACTGIMSVCVGNSTVLGLKLLQTMLLKCFIKKPCFLLEIERFKIATLMGTFVTFIKSIKEKTSQPRKQIQTTFT